MIRSKKYITGDFVEWEVFNVPENIKPFKRQTKIKESTPAQRNLNNKKAQRHFVRLVHNNFCERDLYIDLTYDGDNIPRERRNTQGCTELRKTITALEKEKRHEQTEIYICDFELRSKRKQSQISCAYDNK